MGFFDDLALHLESNLTLFTTFKVDMLSDENNALTLRRYQSAPSLKFMDKGHDDTIGLQVLVRNTDQQTAIDTLEAITDHLVKMETLGDGSEYEFLSCDMYINPLFIEKTDEGAYLYQAMFYCKVFKP